MKAKYAADIADLKKKLKDLRDAGATPDVRLPVLTALREKLVAAIDQSDLKWFNLDLKMGSRTTNQFQYTIQVCSPVMVAGIFVPVSALETWKLADENSALPLTRAVADQQHNEAHLQGNVVEFKTQHTVPNPKTDPTHDHLKMFDEYTDTLSKTAYATRQGKGPVSGSHKLFLVSAKMKDQHTCNYGFCHNGAKLPGSLGDKGPYLFAEYSVVNGLISSGHDWGYWDYSQLLQLMRLLKDGTTLVPHLAQAITDTTRTINFAVWDETISTGPNKPPVRVKMPSSQMPGTKSTFYVDGKEMGTDGKPLNPGKK